MRRKLRKALVTVKECEPREMSRFAWVVHREAFVQEMALWRKAYKECVKRY